MSGESKAKMLSAMAARTGLARETIKDLMKKGWYYEEKLGEPAKFFKDVNARPNNGTR